MEGAGPQAAAGAARRGAAPHAPRHLYGRSVFTDPGPVASWWEASAPPLAVDCPPLGEAARCEVAVIGAGFTGLSCARRLAADHGVEVRVLEAATPGWGASGRNGGFCCLGSARLDYRALVARYGEAEALRFYRVERQAIEQVAAFAAGEGVEVEACAPGETMLAHRPDRVAALAAEREVFAAAYGLDCELLDRAALAERGMRGPEFHAGLRIPVGFGLHPLRYARALAEAAAGAGARLHARSPVIAWSPAPGGHRLRTPEGELVARAVVVATNGYTPENLSPLLAGRLLPALSGILVTRPLSSAELDAQGWRGTELAFDSRRLLHYFRLLPDRRFLFGGRGGTRTGPGSENGWQRRLRADFERMFPAWRAVEDTHRWRGFVCLARAFVPFVGALERERRVFAALAYHGSGVAMASWAGAALADLVAGVEGAEEALPAVVRGPLERFLLARLRRVALAAAYLGYALRDR